MIVLDANVISSLFNSQNSEHQDFKPVLDWVNKCNGASFVFGGTKYKKELSKMTNYLKIMRKLKDAGKLIEIDTNLIDRDAVRLKNICADTAFNDEHIVAILNISGCKLVGTRETRAIPYIKRQDFYSDGKTPKIYSSSKNKKLLTKINIVRLRHTC
ncbi:MAG: hypothetical protein LBH93_07470 [Chitinispirillales bacterium]|jgi:hypothetical protein|nr:hypothetical protein [Chitinispirillales bacterium]